MTVAISIYTSDTFGSERVKQRFPERIDSVEQTLENYLNALDIFGVRQQARPLNGEPVSSSAPNQLDVSPATPSTSTTAPLTPVLDEFQALTGRPCASTDWIRNISKDWCEGNSKYFCKPLHLQQ